MPLQLQDAEQELIAAEAEYFASRVNNPAAQAAYSRLQQAALEGSLEDDLLEVLGGLLEIGLSSGRIRSVHSAHGEMAAASLFRRTPQGRALQFQFTEANQAFAALQGQTIESVSFSAQGPGLYTLTVKTGEARVVTQLKPSGIEVRSVEVSL
ncbi:MAG: hypothetical protein ACRD1R_00260 [Acidobacteriota bacterium]